ncbi:4Fe-4S ferredoxin [candidate division KSB1 bacterium 4484_87]|nr:MAG: 4Fe-4S ferredoxin [candidate division KSB1 bacterium 4484_87]
MVQVKQDVCDFCGTCVSVCPVDAIELLEAVLIIDQEKCIDCMKCVIVCPLRALEGTK